jgi:hypothetical protein
MISASIGIYAAVTVADVTAVDDVGFGPCVLDAVRMNKTRVGNTVDTCA